MTELKNNIIIAAALASLIPSGGYAIDKDAELRVWRELVNTRRYINPREIGVAAPLGSERSLAPSEPFTTQQLPPGVATGVGIQIGLTYYDIQQTGSMNRQIATRGIDHCIYFSWTSKSNNSAIGDYTVSGNTYDAALGGLSEPAAVGISFVSDVAGIIRAFSNTQDAFEDGRATIALHYDPAFATPGFFRPVAFINDLPCLVDFSEMVRGGNVPDTIWEDSLSLGGSYFAWPRVAATDNATCGKTVHLVIHDNGLAGKYMYIRRTIGAGAFSDSNWTDGYVFGQGGFLTPAITASRQSQKVGIAWSGGRGDGSEFGASQDRYNGLISGQNDNDLFYMESQDCGATWGPVRNVTQYPDATTGNYRAHARVTIIYDDRDSLNMAWNASRWNGYGGPFTYQGRIFHWNTDRPTGWDTPGAIRSAVVGEWEPPKCNPGAFNLNVSQPQLSVCNSNLYLTYSEFANPLKGHGDDCHIRASYAPTGAANGDLLLTVSSNYGFSWDPGRDLTASYTPNCDTVPGGEYPDCQSDTWHSATRYGIDITGDIFGMTDVSANLGGYAGSDYLFVQYVNDREPGAAILNEGAWTLSAVRTFRFGCVDWEEESFPIFSLTGIDDPAHALPEQFVDTVLEIENVGNIDLNYTYVVEVTDGPAGNVTVDGTSSGGGTISAGIINKATHTIRLNATQSSEIQNAGARIIFAGDFLTAPDTIFINYCICDIQELVFDTLFDDLTLNRSATSASGLVFGNNGNLGAQDGRALGANSPGGFNFDFTHDPACECDLRSGTGTPQRSAKSYLFDASPIIRYKGGQIVTSMFSFGTIGEHQFRPLEEPYTEIAAPDPLYNHGYSGEFTTQDSVLGLAVDYYLPVDPLPGCWQMAYVRVCYYNNSDSTINDVTLAYGLDWDVPSDSTSPKWVDNVNNFEAGPERSAIWQGGVDYPPSNPAEVDSAWNCLPNSQRWAATSFVVPDTAEYPPFVTGGNAGDKSMGITLPKALYTRENARYVTTEWNLQALDTALDSIFGFSNYQTTQPESTYTDLHTVLNGGEYTLDPSDTAYLWMLLVSCIAVDETAFLEGLDSARARPIPDVIPSQSCCVLRGDTNGDGVVNISDAICVIRYAFCPQGFGCCDFSCLEQADADGGGDVNIGDCIFLVKYIFVAGAPAPPPCP